MSNYENIILEKRDQVVSLTLNRPEKLNALNEKTVMELREALQGLEQDQDFKVLTITGAGRAFCAGGDLNELSKVAESPLGSAAAQMRLRKSHSVASALRRIKQPIITIVNGDAVGAGFSLALLGDLRIAAQSARFGAVFGKVGLIPDLGGVYNLTRAVGVNKACELALLGDLIPAAEAERIGLVNKVVPAEELAEAAQAWAERLVKTPLWTLVLTKSSLYKSLEMDFFSELEDEINTQSFCITTLEARQRIKAFLEKKK